MTPKPYYEFARTVIETLEALGIAYAIGGSFASSRYGETRASIDIDISIILPLETLSKWLCTNNQLPQSNRQLVHY
jgi:hypothetical protein